MNSKIYFTLLLLIGLAACNNNSVDPEFNYQQTSQSIDTGKDKLQSTSPAINTQQQNQPTLVTTPTKSNGSNKNLNPEHGQPGHRCDIAVGAPLDSKPVTTTQQIQPQPVNKTQPVVTTKTTTASGMNPPHGEPGHRCDIAVGTPLSQPVKKNDTPGQNIKTVSPIVKDSTKNN